MPSSTNKSPLEAYHDAYTDVKSKQMLVVTPVTSSQRSSFDDSMKNMQFSQSDCAKDRHSLAEFMTDDHQSPRNKHTVGQGLLKVTTGIDYTDDEESSCDEQQLSSEEENLIAESTSAIERLFSGEYGSRKQMSRFLYPESPACEDVDDSVDEV